MADKVFQYATGILVIVFVAVFSFVLGYERGFVDGKNRLGTLVITSEGSL